MRPFSRPILVVAAVLGTATSSGTASSISEDGASAAHQQQHHQQQQPACPNYMTQVDTFTLNNTAWAACEDLQRPDGAIALVPASGEPQWFTKGLVCVFAL